MSKNKGKFINAYEIPYKEMVQSIESNKNNSRTTKAKFQKDAFERDNDYFNPASWID